MMKRSVESAQVLVGDGDELVRDDREAEEEQRERVHGPGHRLRPSSGVIRLRSSQRDEERHEHDHEDDREPDQTAAGLIHGSQSGVRLGIGPSSPPQPGRASRPAPGRRRHGALGRLVRVFLYHATSRKDTLWASRDRLRCTSVSGLDRVLSPATGSGCAGRSNPRRCLHAEHPLRRAGRRRRDPPVRLPRTGSRSGATGCSRSRRRRFPREKTCGDGLTPRAVRQLDDMGLADPLSEFHRYEGLRSMAHGITLELRWPDHPDFPAYGYVVRRRDLDEMVADRAVKAGATVWQGGRGPGADPRPWARHGGGDPPRREWDHRGGVRSLHRGGGRSQLAVRPGPRDPP